MRLAWFCMVPKIKRIPRISSTCVLWKLNPLNAHFRKEECLHVQKKQKMLVNVYFQTSMDLFYKIISNMLDFIYIA